MIQVGQRERDTQNRIVKLFQNQLNYTYLGNWKDRSNNSNIEEDVLIEYLTQKGYNLTLITKAIHKFKTTANSFNNNLYRNNKNVYKLLRYGVKVKAEVGENFETVYLIDWKNPAQNHFAVAEEVTLKGNREKRPDIVLYINGIALGVLELKRSTVSIGDGIRQSIVNQQEKFIQPFFSTIQFVFAGNDTEGLRYGTIETPEKFFLKWKEDVQESELLLLDKYLLKMCDKARFLELIYNFVLFDGGKKKLPRFHQYFGIKAAQKHVDRRESGIIWHTQGSGKSIIMVLLAKWILENHSNARVAVITDRDELDKQIERIFNDMGEPIKRASSGQELLNQLTATTPRLICSLVHKFGRKNEPNFENFIKNLENQPIKVVGELFVFVDECHRTQSGKMHKIMKTILPEATFIGFTGTPLLKKDKQTSLEVFGKYIHTYKFNEAVKDEIVLDLVYEARDIEQKLSSADRIDKWFDSKTKGLNDFQKSELKKRWGTMQNVLSSRSRMEKIVQDIVFDFETKPRLISERGNAILIASRIYDACRYFELFENTPLKNKCAVVTSYNPSTKDIITEDTGANTDTEKEFVYNIYTEILKEVKSNAGKSKTETYEDEAKSKFIEEPAKMKLLIVVDKLLTGFDAPSCSSLYIDKSMKDHGLFQAICRVNRLDTEDKQFGYIIDYKDLFSKTKDAISVYTSELDYDQFKKEDCEILLEDRLSKGKERLDSALEQVEILCEPVNPPKELIQYLRYFCGNTEIKEDLKKREPQRTALYKFTVALLRAYANIAGEMEEAGYSEKEIEEIKKRLDFYLNLREEIRRASGETLDLKTYEADMRYLIDNYIQAEESKVISPFDENTSLLDLIANEGIEEAIKNLPKGFQNDNESVAETIENNVRQKIIKEYLIDPAFFEEMSKLLDEIIKKRKNKALEYEEYLKKVAELVKEVNEGKGDSVPEILKTKAQRSLYHNLENDENLAIQCDQVIRKVKKADWKGNLSKEKEIKAALLTILKTEERVEHIFDIVKEQAEY